MSAMDAVENYIITGDEKGNLYTYEINENSLFSLSHSINIAKGKIEQIKCLNHLKQAYVLINGIFYIYNIPRLDLILEMKKLTIYKFCHNEHINFSNRVLFITKKKRLNFFDYNSEARKLVDSKLDELMCSELPEVAEFYGDWISMVTKKKMVLMNVNGNVLTQDFEITYAKNVFGSWLIYTNYLGIFMENNIAVQKNPITFNTKPLLGMAVYKNYIIVQYDSLIEVFDGNDSLIVQEILNEHNSMSRLLTVSGKRVFFMAAMQVEKKGSIPTQQVWELRELAFQKQISKLLSELKIDDALNILNNNISSSDENKGKKIEQFFLDCGWACLKKNEYRKASQYIQLCNFNPFEIIYLFANILDIRINDPDIKKNLTNIYIENITKGNEDLTTDALKMLFDLLYNKRNLLNNIYEIPKELTKKINFLDSEAALINLSKVDYSLFQVYEIIHTTLVKIHVKSKINMKALYKLTESNDFNCDYEVLQPYLEKTNTDESKVSLAYLSERKEKFEEALKIWLDFGSKSDSNVAYSKEACERTKIILKKSKDKKLFHDYIQWILEKYPDSAFDLFLNSDIVPVEFFFTTIIGNLEKVKSNLNLKEKFLEFYINNNCVTERYHTMLLEIYIEKIFKIRKADLQYEKSLIEGNLKYNLEKFDKLLRSSNYYNPNFILEKIQNSWLVDQEIYLYSKLGKHMEALTKLVNIGLEYQDFEKAEQYCIDANSSELFAYLFKIISDNYTIAMNQAKTAQQDLARKQQENLASTYHKQILYMLKNYGNNEQLDPFLVLQQLSGDWSISDMSLYEYLTNIMKTYSHKSNKYKISKSMSEMAQLYKERDLGIVRNKAVTIGLDTNCELCKKKIGSTIFCVYPNMKIYHHKCATNLNVCPVTKNDFSKKNFV